jgi:hypothetical protein
MNKRYLSRTLIVVGSILIIAGLVFTAQSKSIVGPQSSFMYSNPEWTVNGFLISGVGYIALLPSFQVLLLLPFLSKVNYTESL